MLDLAITITTAALWCWVGYLAGRYHERRAVAHTEAPVPDDLSTLVTTADGGAECDHPECRAEGQLLAGLVGAVGTVIGDTTGRRGLLLIALPDVDGRPTSVALAIDPDAYPDTAVAAALLSSVAADITASQGELNLRGAQARGEGGQR